MRTRIPISERLIREGFDPRLASVHIVSGLGAGAGPGPGPGPNADFIIWVTKGGNDTTGNGTDEAPFLTITKAYNVAKTLGLSTTQNARVLVGPGQFTENLLVPPFVWTVGSGVGSDVVINGTVALDSAAWIASTATEFTQSDMIGVEIAGVVTIDFTGVGASGVAFLFESCGLGSDLNMTGDATNGGGVSAFQTVFFADITATALAESLASFGCFFEGNLTFTSTAAQNCGWDSIGDSTLIAAPITITLDATAGNTVVGNIESFLANSGTLILNGAGASWRAGAGGTPSIVTLMGGAPAPTFESPLVTLNSKLPTGANAALDDVASADGAGNVVWKSPAAATGTRAYYGDKSDGIVNVVGTLTLTRDVFYDTLTLAPGTQVNTNGFRIYADTIHNDGVIFNDGANAAGQTHGAGATGSTVFGGTDGADGVVATLVSGAMNGNPGTSQTAGGGNHSGTGGTGGNAGVGTGGVGGVLNVLGPSEGDVRANPQATIGAFIGINTVGGVVTSPISIAGGTGGGSGAAGPVNPNSTSGGGGGGGGCIVISCRIFDGNGQVEAIGGAGAAGVSGNAGGGGGGGGGTLILTFGDSSGYTGSFSAIGGAGGAGIGTGTNGASGADGTIIQVPG